MADKGNPQAERDKAERDKQQASAAKAATVDNDRNAVEQAARQGGGPAGLNSGPSDTVSRDPHAPVSGAPLYGNQGANPRSDGMGQSPPKGPRPTSDKPEGTDALGHRAAMSGSKEAVDAHEANQAERKTATEAEADADARLKAANEKIAGKQGEGEGEKQRKERE